MFRTSLRSNCGAEPSALCRRGRGAAREELSYRARPALTPLREEMRPQEEMSGVAVLSDHCQLGAWGRQVAANDTTNYC